jgi:uncharacterized membrane protein YeaQ/YmgE (transglycosylase-associated protein family)
MSDLIWEGLIGLVVGGIARFASPERTPGGLVLMVIVGIAGSVLAGYAGEKTGWYRPGETMGLVMSGAGALLLLAVFRFLSGGGLKPPKRDEYDDL